MKSLIHVKGPPNAGPGERQEMQARAVRFLDQSDASSTLRIDVPERGSDSEGEGSVRGELEPLIPALQSGSLFSDKVGIEVFNAQWIRASEAEILASLLGAMDPAAVTVVLVTSGALPNALTKAVKALGEVHKVEKYNDRRARDWLMGEARGRGIALPPDAIQALSERFGTNVAALGQALDQLESVDEPITGRLVRDRFKNRPDEGMWRYAESVAGGSIGDALRHLEGLMIHSHPLALVSYLEGDLRQRALASAAPNIEVFAGWMRSSSDNWRIEKAWRGRGKATDSDLHRALSALTRADRLLKSAPEETHQLTMERLTIALCRWYGGGRRTTARR